MTAGIAALAALGLLLVLGRPEVMVVYQMVLAVDAIILAGGFWGIRYLKKKDEELEKRSGQKE